jgi:hypothetical protein
MLSTPSALCFVDFPVETMVLVRIQGADVIDIVLERAVRNAVVGAGTVSSEARDGVEDAGIDEVACIQRFLPVSDIGVREKPDMLRRFQGWIYGWCPL